VDENPAVALTRDQINALRERADHAAALSGIGQQTRDLKLIDQANDELIAVVSALFEALPSN
jgi:hypothetical protein